MDSHGSRDVQNKFQWLKFEDQRASGIGVVMQDETGFVIAALSKKL